MPDPTELVRIPKSLMGIYREWASNSGRSLQGMLSLVLSNAAENYMDGKKSGIDDLANCLNRSKGAK